MAQWQYRKISCMLRLSIPKWEAVQKNVVMPMKEEIHATSIHSLEKKVLPDSLGEVCLFLKSIWMELSRTWQLVSAFWFKQCFLRFFHVFLTQFKCLVTEWCWILGIRSILFIRFFSLLNMHSSTSLCKDTCLRFFGEILRSRIDK